MIQYVLISLSYLVNTIGAGPILCLLRILTSSVNSTKDTDSTSIPIISIGMLELTPLIMGNSEFTDIPIAMSDTRSAADQNFRLGLMLQNPIRTSSNPRYIGTPKFHGLHVAGDGPPMQSRYQRYCIHATEKYIGILARLISRTSSLLLLLLSTTWKLMIAPPFRESKHRSKWSYVG
jgi:hypothetical protein